MDKNRQHHINVSACHGVRLKCPSSSCLLHVNLNVISKWLYFVLRHPLQVLRGSNTVRSIQHVAHELINLTFQFMWMRLGGPIQTLSLHSGALSTLKCPLYTVSLCLDLCHVTLWPSKRRLLRLVSKKGKQWAIVSLSTAGFGFTGLYHFLNLQTLVIGGLSTSLWCFPAQPSSLIWWFFTMTSYTSFINWNKKYKMDILN